MKVDLEKLSAALLYIREVNLIPFKDVEWLSHGTPVQIADIVKEEFSFVGLSNATFADICLLNNDGTVKSMEVNSLYE